ncbi:MAG: hypothetical protein A3G34_04430 [Candidatus Lindowbacteria bacterium RIFCSPLOWO2_12_FULL_62_27]|nr:MAG: hypothetical protein A3G34_04430 [Candidatus Lindowbacteria bacterium RIFCSPLOWO2_12_FULL_62_27]OGH61693.1 MAG: hypothetical protein A3I06_11715 [Candidatus Lindowbacteria bacterium RIFCSPLOWO2_02_FULL_62_12]
MAYGDQTLLAGTVLKLVQQAVQDGKKLREKNTARAEIEKIMRAKGFSPHNARRIVKDTMGEPLEDEIAPADIVDTQEIKSNTVRVTVRRDLGVDIHDIVRFRARDFQAQMVKPAGDGFVYTLKEFSVSKP